MAGATRVKDVSVARPIMYGNFTVPLESKDRRKDTPVDHTHKWTVFVRDPAGKDDLSYFIKKVVFKLHDTYQQPHRTIEKPPFEVTETGWGEFEIQIRIYFAPVAGEKPVMLYHHLKLHPYGPEFKENPPPMLPTGVPVPQNVESVVYDELVFVEPTEGMLELMVSRPGNLLRKQSDVPRILPFSYSSEKQEFDRVNEAADVIRKQLKETQTRIKELEKRRDELQEQI